MFKRLIVALLAFLAISVFAADANTASQADLEAIKGIGPSIASKIVDERKNGNFKDWPDLVNRVKGIGTTSAGRLSTAGLTVNGATYNGPVEAKPLRTTTPAVAKMSPAAASAADPKVAVLANNSAIASGPAATAPAPAASSAKEQKKADADAKKAAKARKKADKEAAAASAASANAAKKK